MRYKVIIKEVYSVISEVEAESEDEARIKALDGDIIKEEELQYDYTINTDIQVDMIVE